jgi:hypothetical protein
VSPQGPCEARRRPWGQKGLPGGALAVGGVRGRWVASGASHTTALSKLGGVASEQPPYKGLFFLRKKSLFHCFTVPHLDWRTGNAFFSREKVPYRKGTAKSAATVPTVSLSNTMVNLGEVGSFFFDGVEKAGQMGCLGCLG